MVTESKIQSCRGVPLRIALLSLFVAMQFMRPTALAAVDVKASPQSVASAAPLRFQLLDGYVIVVQSPIGDTGKVYNVIIDTGANPSVIDSKAAAALGLTRNGVGLSMDWSARRD